MEVIELIQKLADLQDNYSLEKRNLITIDKYRDLLVPGLVEKGDYKNPILQETLMSHVGHLPILASFLHPYIEHSAEVDLGKVLTMLAIHDIGESVAGDVYSYHKTEQEDQVEFQAALTLIHPTQIATFKEYEERESLESQYAKSIDILAPIVHAISLAQLTIDQACLHGVTVQLVADKQEEYFIWDSVLLEIFTTCITHYKAVEEGNEPLFKQKI